MDVKVYQMTFPGEETGAVHLALVPHPQGAFLEVGSGVAMKRYQADTSEVWDVTVPAGAVQTTDHIGRPVIGWMLNGDLRKSTADEVLALARLGLHGFAIK